MKTSLLFLVPETCNYNETFSPNIPSLGSSSRDESEDATGREK